MSNPDVTAFVDDAAVTAAVTTEARAPAASFVGGVNAGASNSPGIGINQGGGTVDGRPSQFTLLDQFGNARAAQKGQCIGGPGISAAGTSAGQEGTLPDAVIRFGPQDAAYPDGSGEITFTGNSTLTSLAGGWVIQV